MSYRFVGIILALHSLWNCSLFRCGSNPGCCECCDEPSCYVKGGNTLNKRPTSCYLLFYFTSYVLNMFRALIYPSSGACDSAVELPHRSFCSRFVVCWRLASACNTDTTQTQPHQISNSLQHGHYSNPAAPNLQQPATRTLLKPSRTKSPTACNTDTTQTQPHQISNSLQHGHYSNPAEPNLQQPATRTPLKPSRTKSPTACNTDTTQTQPHKISNSLQHGHHSNPAAPNLQHTTNREQNDPCGNSTAQSQAPDDGYINVRNMLST